MTTFRPEYLGEPLSRHLERLKSGADRAMDVVRNWIKVLAVAANMSTACLGSKGEG